MIDMLRWLWNKLMKWGWDFNRREEVVSLASSRMGEPVVRINMSNAINGRVLEIATQQQKNRDWDVEMYIVADGESLHDALATLLLTKGLK